MGGEYKGNKGLEIGYDSTKEAKGPGNLGWIVGKWIRFRVGDGTGKRAGIVDNDLKLENSTLILLGCKQNICGPNDRKAHYRKVYLRMGWVLKWLSSRRSSKAWWKERKCSPKW